LLSQQLLCILFFDNKFKLYEKQHEICRAGIHQQQISAAIALLEYIFASSVEEPQALKCQSNFAFMLDNSMCVTFKYYIYFCNKANGNSEVLELQNFCRIRRFYYLKGNIRPVTVLEDPKGPDGE
jgi:hypothetical protein